VQFVASPHAPDHIGDVYVKQQKPLAHTGPDSQAAPSARRLDVELLDAALELDVDAELDVDTEEVVDSELPLECVEDALEPDPLPDPSLHTLGIGLVHA